MAHWLAAASLRRSQQLLWDCRNRSLARTVNSLRACETRRATLPIGDNGVTSRVAQRASSLLLRRTCYGSIRRRNISQTARRQYASSAPLNTPGILSETKEHSPGHNIATLSVSNPAKLNILNSSLLDSLAQKCHDLNQDPNLRAVILTGAPTNAGKAASFIGGADIKEMIELSSSSQARAFIDRIHAACEGLRAIPVPVIARIDGFCLGAGMEIAAACDLRIATRGSVFGMPEVKVGIPSVVEAAYLPGVIGMGRTRRLLYLAENIGAVEAERWGFVERLVEDEVELERVTKEWVGALVGMGPKAIRSQKVLMQRWEDVSVREGIELGARAYAEAYADGGKEPREFMGRFVGRRR